MNVTKKILGGALAGVIACSTPGLASAFTADDSYNYTSSTGAWIGAQVDFLGTRSADVWVVVKDAPGDQYCTIAEAELYANDSAGYRKLGNTINLGAVCNGNTATLPIKRISTTAGDIFEVRVQTRRGTGGPWATIMGLCRRAQDGPYDNCV